jgi:phage terminase large subunit GpA-like protein
VSEWAGYAKLRKGRIHLLCPRCGRKQSNMPRMTSTSTVEDPPRAEMCHVLCETCSQGGKDSSMTFLDARGKELCSYCGERCELVGTTRRCTERLINESVARSAAEMEASNGE